MKKRASVSVCALLFAVGCGGGGSGKSAKAPDPEPEKKSGGAESESSQSEAAASDSKKEEAGPVEMPTECAKKGESICAPPKAFVDRLCSQSNPAVAIALFKKGSPWTRGYMRGKTKAWNASGGASDNNDLEFDEEILVLRQRAADLGGMQVSGAGGGIDALRWNGACVTLAKEEVTMSTPPKPKSAHVEWRLLDEKMRDAMRNDDKVNKAFLARQKECKGATMGTVSDKCVKFDNALSEAIVEYVRNGGDVPKPDKLP
jgi:hypothetical protein